MKSCRIYWFSGTGNSLWAAKVLARHLHAELTHMPSAMHGTELPDAAMIGLVFPVYNHLIPYLVQRFVQQSGFLAGKSVFAVCTCGDSPCIALEYLQKRIAGRGGTLIGGFSVKLPYNYISPTRSLRSVFQPFRLRESSPGAQAAMFAAAEAKLVSIAQSLLADSWGTLETEYERTEHLLDRLNLRNTLQKRVWLHKAGFRGKTKLTSVESVQLMDAGFWATDACVGCRTCAQLCPVKNIHFVSNRPVWQHHCEQCFACLQWCPARAIQFGQGTQDGTRYHHPMICMDDMMITKYKEETP